MAYALDFIVGIVCGLVSLPLLMQLRPFTRYKRFVDAEGNPIDVRTMARDGMVDETTTTVAPDFAAFNGWRQEFASLPGRDAPPPNGGGWIRDAERRKKFLDYLSAFYGVLLMIAAAVLVISPNLPTGPLALALFIGAGLIVAKLVPMLLRVIGGQRTHPVTFIHSAFAATGIVAGLRLF